MVYLCGPSKASHLSVSYINKEQNKGDMPLPRLSPIPFKDVEFRDGMASMLVNDFPLFLCYFEGWSMADHHIPKSFLLCGEIFWPFCE